MDLDELRPGRPHLGRGVPHGVGVVGEGSRVDHDVGARIGRLVEPADELGLGVGLPDVGGKPEVARPALDESCEVGVTRGSVYVRFSRTEPGEVGPGKYQYGFHSITVFPPGAAAEISV